jgi:isoquinoline 1-oxidoreductase
MVLGDTDRPWDMGTFGCKPRGCSVPRCAPPRPKARQVLLRLASARLGVPKERLVVENGIVSVKGEPARKVSYGALAKGRAIVRTVDEKAVLRSVPQFTVMGRSPRRLDALDKVTGAGKYAGDIRLPGLLHARSCARPPTGRPSYGWIQPKPRRWMA